MIALPNVSGLEESQETNPDRSSFQEILRWRFQDTKPDGEMREIMDQLWPLMKATPTRTLTEQHGGNR